jgi:ABC-type glycerol-3-phosphate transport system substrate-binding protein
MKVIITIFTLGIVSIIVAGCGTNFKPPIYATHTWEAEEGQILENAVDSFASINDSLIFVESTSDVPIDLSEQLSAGLGPDIIIGLPYAEIIPLAEAGLIRDLSGYDIDTSSYLPEHLRALTYGGKLYGLPFMANSQVLFYNKTLVAESPTTLSELLEEADRGNAVAIPVSFQDAFWGIPAFGGRLFSDEGDVDPTPESYKAWFDWLRSAQAQTGIVTDTDPELLTEKFVNSEVAYLIAFIEQYRQLDEGLGENQLGVAPLPGVLTRPDAENPEDQVLQRAGSLLPLETIVFNQASDEEYLEMSLQLAEFLNNPALQRKMLVANVQRAPTNISVFVRQDLSEAGNAVMRQSRTGITIPLDRLVEFETFSDNADAVYLELLEGGAEPEETTAQLIHLLSTTFGAQ